MIKEYQFNREKNELPPFGHIRWNCRRGMKELEVLLIPFADHFYRDLTIEKQHQFIDMLEYDDASLYTWFLGYEQPPSTDIQSMVEEVQNAVKDLLSDPTLEERL